MSGDTITSTGSDRRAERRASTRDAIVAAAWQLAREQGLTGWAMRDLGARMGMKAQSLYSYFAGKHEIFDAMFQQGYAAFGAHMGVGDPARRAGTTAAARADAHAFFEFCVSDPVRYQMLFLRTIPGFEPSAESYGAAVAVLEEMDRRTVALGATPGAVDLWTAVFTGLASQQIANDPGGDRWERLVDQAFDMVLAHTTAPRRRSTKGAVR